MAGNDNPSGSNSGNKGQKPSSNTLSEHLRESVRDRSVIGDALSRHDGTITNKQAQPPAPPRPKGK